MSLIANTGLGLESTSYMTDDQGEVRLSESRVTRQLLDYTMGRPKSVQDHITQILADQTIKGHFTLTVYRNRAVLVNSGRTVTLSFEDDCDQTVTKVKAFRFQEHRVGGDSHSSPPSPPAGRKAFPPPPPPPVEPKDPLKNFTPEEKKAYRAIKYRFLDRYTAVKLSKKDEFNAADVKNNLAKLLNDMKKLQLQSDVKEVRDMQNDIRENTALVLNYLPMLREAPNNCGVSHNDRAEVDRLAREIIAFKYVDFTSEEKEAYRAIQQDFLDCYAKTKGNLNVLDVIVGLEKLQAEMEKLRNQANTPVIQEMLQAIHEKAQLIRLNITRQTIDNSRASVKDHEKAESLARAIRVFSY